MKQIMRIFPFLFLLLFGLSAFGQESSLLWKISGKGLKKPSYLFGTIHIICADDYIWTPAMKEALEKSEKLCLEIDLSDAAALAQGMMGMIDMNTELSSYFSAEQYRRLTKYAKDSMGLGEAELQHMKPAIVMLLLSTKEAVGSCAESISYEEKIMDAAQKKHKKVMGLETVGDQLNALSSMPADSVVKYIMEWVDGTAVTDDKSEYTKLVSAYKLQDIVALQALMQESDGLSGSMEVLVNDRNRKWIGRMGNMMNGNSVFFAVGAGHLAGPKGVVNLLKNEGYTVVPVK